MDPQTLGRFEILGELDRGPLGPACSARDPRSGESVELTRLDALAELPADRRAETWQRIRAEAAAFGRLRHPAIARVIELDESVEPPLVVSERVEREGQGLDALLRQKARTDRVVALEFVAQAAEALSVAHLQGIVHGNLKPAVLTRGGSTALRIRGFDLGGLAASRLTDPASGSCTPRYLAPEQVRGARATAASDLFSLAAVLYELLLGRPAFPGNDVASILYRTVHEAAQDPLTIDPAFDRELCDLLRRSLSKRPEERPPDLEAFALALRSAVVESRRSGTVGGDPAMPDAPGGSSIPPRPPRRGRAAARPLRLAVLGFVVVAAAGTVMFRDRLMPGDPPPPAVVWLETTVRTEPPGLEVRLDGIPLDLQASDRVRFRSDGPFGKLSTSQGCRSVEHLIGPADAGGEVVLLADPQDLGWTVDPGVPGAIVELNGRRVGSAPFELSFDLCRDNELVLRADGFRPSTLRIPSGATRSQARELLFSLALEPIPRGTIELPRSSVELAGYVDGKRLGRNTYRVQLEEGEHTVRLKNDFHWIDLSQLVRVEGDRTVTADSFRIPALAELVVQAFPANCKLYLRRPGEAWKYVDDTPFSRKLALGRYQVKIEWITSGATEERELDLVEGRNPPIRVSFRR